AQQREEAAAPPYVAKALSGTNQAARTARDDAVLLTARAHATADPAERTALERHATEAVERAAVLEHRVASLTVADTARAVWWVRNAVTRDYAERATSELVARGIDPHSAENTITVADWFHAHRAERIDSEPHQVVTETDVDEFTVERASLVIDPGSAETNVPDIRELASLQPPTFDNDDDWDHVARVSETRDALDRAHRALLEDAARRDWEAQREVEYRSLHAPPSHTTDSHRADADTRAHDPILEY
ncbi:MAG: hypothetical protein ACRDTT_07260, partial [Pseudonocardiaceae bacterium]